MKYAESEQNRWFLLKCRQLRANQPIEIVISLYSERAENEETKRIFGVRYCFGEFWEEFETTCFGDDICAEVEEGFKSLSGDYDSSGSLENDSGKLECTLKQHGFRL